jgi:hypothetical protein
MANELGLNGAQDRNAPTRFAPIYTGRWSSGYWTNRSPLRDATTSRIVEKFYGKAGDALIAGSNVEITNRLTLSRRPGNPVFDSNSYSSPLSYYSFREFSATTEQILVMIDQADALYSLYAGTKSTLWTKSSGAGQSYMQSVGNTLFFANGIDNKKYLNSLTTWSASAQWNTAVTPYFTTWLIDPNGNIQQLMATVVPVIGIEVASNVLTVISSESTLTDVLEVGMEMTFPEGMTASFLDNQIVTITGVTSTTFTAAFINDDYVGAESGIVATETTGGANPISGATVPSWSTVVPAAGNDFQGGITIDGMVQWVNRGSPVQNWGIQPTTGTLQPSVGTSNISWRANTYYSLPGVIVDTNGNLQQVTVAGKSGATAPTWATTVGLTTTDGSVTWTMIQTAASLVWQPNTSYAATLEFALTSVASSVGSSAVYTGAITNGAGTQYVLTSADNASSGSTTYNGTFTGATTGSLVGTTVVIAGFDNTANNGVFLITANSGTTSITVNNAAGVADTHAATATVSTYTGKTVVVNGFLNSVNNGLFICSASTASTLTLSNAGAVAETNAATAISRGAFVIGNAYGVNCLFTTSSTTQPSLTGNVSAYVFPGNGSGNVGVFTQTYPTPTSGALASDTTLTSLYFEGYPLDPSPGAELQWAVVNSAGTVVGWIEPFPSYTNTYTLIILASIYIPVAGTYTFTINHHDGMIWGMGSNGSSTPTLVSGTNSTPVSPPQTVTAAQGFPVFGGTNRGLEGGGTWDEATDSWVGAPVWTDTFTVTFNTAGVYPVEVDYAYWYHDGQQFNILVNGYPLANTTVGSLTGTSGPTQPVWPSWTTQFAPNYPTITENGGQLTWENLGPVTDFSWSASTNFTLPNTTIVDPAGNIEAPYRTGVSGSVAPTFLTGLNSLTLDNPNLIWINEGTAGAAPVGTVSTFNGGWKYCISLVNTLDNTVSNSTDLSVSTGNFVGVKGVTFAPAEGLPALSQIDPQADYVAIFRTVDGGDTPLLIPSQIPVAVGTVPLSTYLVSGYVDTTPDVGLDNLVQAPFSGENTPPAIGAQNLTYHISRLWYSVGNVVYYTSGPSTPAGNGLNGTQPLLNNIPFPSLVKRIVPTVIGAIVFTVSDIWVVQGSASSNDPIRNPQYLAQGVGLPSYNALDVNGGVIGFFTTDNQFCELNPNGIIDYVGFPIGDQLRLKNGTPGQNWIPANVYVTWYVNGEDQGWFLSDGQYGWYKLIPTPAPEQGKTWSPFATIVGGCKAVKAIETAPGVHTLLVGPYGTGPLLARDLTSSLDNTSTYEANAVIGSAVLAQPGQIAVVSFVATDSVNVGTPLVLGVILDEALPYYTGSFNILKRWENDPPGLKKSKSLFPQRFYLSELTGEDDEAACRHMQIKVIWAAENAPNELISLTVFGGYLQEN